MGSLPQIEAGRYKLEEAGDIRLLREHKGGARGRCEGSFKRKFPEILMLDIEAKGHLRRSSTFVCWKWHFPSATCSVFRTKHLISSRK